MSILRNEVHGTIQSGATLYATVEQYALGRATVRLNPSGSRLTNLAVIGGDVEVGDTVVVDYSAGTAPIVRSIFTEAEPEIELDNPDVELPEVANLAQVTQEDYPVSNTDLRPDIGCLVHCEHGWWNDSVYWFFYILYPNQPFLMPFGFNEGVEYNDGDYYEMHYAAQWTSVGMVDLTSLMGNPYVTITVSGKYIIIANWNDFISTLVGNLAGYYRVRIIKNDTDILGVATAGPMNGEDGEPGISLTKIVELTQGDRISMELFHTYPIDYEIDNWGYYDDLTRSMIIQLIPFTTQE